MPNYKIVYRDKDENDIPIHQTVVIRAKNMDIAVIKFESMIGGYFIEDIDYYGE